MKKKNNIKTWVYTVKIFSGEAFDSCYFLRKQRTVKRKKRTEKKDWASK